MAELVTVEVEGFDESDYKQVNQNLGLDMYSGTGDMPAGMLANAAGPMQGGWKVVEVWVSRADQENFLHSRLGAAMQQAGATSQPKISWFPLVAYTTPGK
jgi:hypothetical protein